MPLDAEHPARRAPHAAKGWDSPYDHEPRIAGNGASPFHPAYGRDGFFWTCSCGRRGRRRFVQWHEAMLAWERHECRKSAGVRP